MCDRCDASERRAELNIHAANLERDDAVLTFKAQLGNALYAQLADVPDAIPNEHFANAEEEVLLTRLRAIRSVLIAQGVL